MAHYTGGKMLFTQWCALLAVFVVMTIHNIFHSKNVKEFLGACCITLAILASIVLVVTSYNHPNALQIPLR
ncbi:MAG: hypothetical protein Greene101449_1027 [Candidatus Peregrinibacteria bacterium Greene1014_49]|nr:MAG: hypothetical protein Greene101449_1027 [Candidatus Peregrinibacteria bacterium Greene1014_49]